MLAVYSTKEGALVGIKTSLLKKSYNNHDHDNYWYYDYFDVYEWEVGATEGDFVYSSDAYYGDFPRYCAYRIKSPLYMKNYQPDVIDNPKEFFKEKYVWKLCNNGKEYEEFEEERKNQNINR